MLTVLVSLAVAGCLSHGGVAYAPVDNVGFAEMRELRELDGIYRDRSERVVHRSGEAYLVESLTGLLWRSALVAAVTVEVRARDADSLSIKAHDRHGVVLGEQILVSGRDFGFVDGRLRFRRSNLLLQDRQDELFGPDVTDVELGIDQRGDLKVRTVFRGAGVVVLVPAVVDQTMEFRFLRVGD